MWLITNRADNIRETGSVCLSFIGYKVITNQSILGDSHNQPQWIIDGYILPRATVSGFEQTGNPSALLSNFFSRFGDDFINYLKGNFVIVQIRHNGFKIYSDHFGIRKFFRYQNGETFIFSNDLKIVTKLVAVTPSKENMAVYALSYHFIGGITMFDNVFYNKGAEVVKFGDSKLSFSNYWDPEDLISKTKEGKNHEPFDDIFDSILNSYLKYYATEHLSLSLTGGVDSRLLFSVLKDQKGNLHTYTYGNPHSVDCKLAKRIAEDYKIPHSIHDIKFSVNSFGDTAREVVRQGQSLCSLHRAHRLKAIEQEAAFANSMFLGTMGGEFVKGADHDDYIISDFIFEFSKYPCIDTIRKFLHEKAVNVEEVDLHTLLDFFRNQRCCANPGLVDFYALIDIAASLHHAQNDMLYNQYFKNIFTPFTDIDYLEALFQSGYNFLNKRKFHTGFYRRLDNLRFGTDILNNNCPGLMKYPYNSGFKSNEYLQNRYYGLIRSRIRKRKWENISNFSLGDFMKSYTVSQLESIKENNTLVDQVFNTRYLLDQLQTIKAKPTEAFWLRYTTPVQMMMTLELF